MRRCGGVARVVRFEVGPGWVGEGAGALQSQIC